MRRLLVVVALAPLLGCDRLDLAAGHRFLCSRDAGRDEVECPGGWRCGWEGYCIDPSKPARWLCQTNDDCSGGWHCGKQGFCYPRGDAGPMVCRPDVPEDCAPLWRCGLEGVCHDRGVGAAYACALDGDCEQGWRCGPDALCVDSEEDALSPTPDAGALASARVSPMLLDHRPRALAVSDPFPIPTCGAQPTAQKSVSFVTSAGVLTKVVQYDGLGLPLSADGGWVAQCDGGPTRYVHTEVASYPLPGPEVAALAELGSLTAVLATDGGVRLFGFKRPSTLAPKSVPSPTLPMQRLRAGDPWSPSVLALSENAYTGLFLVEGATWLDPQVLANDAGVPLGLNDLAVLSDPFAGNVLVAATDLGLFGAVSPGGTWPAAGDFTQVAIPTQPCPDSTLAARALLRAGSDPSVLGVVIRRVAPWAVDSLLLLRSGLPDAGPDLGCPYLPVSNGMGAQAFSGLVGDTACATCQVDEAMEDVAISAAGSGRYDVQFRCVATDGGSRLLLRAGTDCRSGEDVDLGTFTQGTLVADSNPRQRAYAGEWGELWISYWFATQVQPLFLASLPEGVIDDGVQTWATTSMKLSPPTKATPAQVVVDVGQFVYSPALGFSGVWRQDNVSVSSGVEGRTDWGLLWITSAQNQSGLDFPPIMVKRVPESAVGVDFPYRFVSVAVQDQSFGPPFHAAVAPLPDGGSVLVLSAFDALLSAEVSSTALEPLSAQDPASFELAPKLDVVQVPLSRRPITALTALAPTTGSDSRGRYAEGYLVSSGRLFRYRADDPVVWRTDEVLLDPAEIAKLWHEGRKVRVGYRDGAIFTLPSRVQVAPAIAPGATAVVDFAQVCGNVFALGTTGLYRLVVEAGHPVGRWQGVSLASAGQGLSYAGGRLRASGQELWVFLPHGFVERVSGIACAP